MKRALIIQLVEFAIALAQSGFAHGDTTDLLTRILQRSINAYEANTGRPLDPNLIKAETSI